MYVFRIIMNTNFLKCWNKKLKLSESNVTRQAQELLIISCVLRLRENQSYILFNLIYRTARRIHGLSERRCISKVEMLLKSASNENGFKDAAKVVYWNGIGL
jgi:hypothetical protein